MMKTRVLFLFVCLVCSGTNGNEVKKVIGLLDELPMVLESMVYTFSREPKMLYKSLSKSWESFCSLDLSSVFMVRDTSLWDAQDWLTRCCSLLSNSERLVSELSPDEEGIELIAKGQYQGLNDIGQAVERASTGIDRLSSQLANLFSDEGWTSVIEELEKINIRDLKRQLEGEKGYTENVILMDKVFNKIIGILTDSEKGSSITKISNLIAELPQLFASLLYTKRTNPHAMPYALHSATSLSSLCATGREGVFISTMFLTVPPGSTWVPGTWIHSACTLEATKWLGDFGVSDVVSFGWNYLWSSAGLRNDLPDVVNKAKRAASLMKDIDFPANIRLLDADRWLPAIEQAQAINAGVSTPAQTVQLAVSLAQTDAPQLTRYIDQTVAISNLYLENWLEKSSGANSAVSVAVIMLCVLLTAVWTRL